MYAILTGGQPVTQLSSLAECVERIGIYIAMWGPTAQQYDVAQYDEKGKLVRLYDTQQVWAQSMQQFDHHVYQYRFDHGHSQPRWAKE